MSATIKKMLRNRGKLFCAFVDLKKAFDSIYHHGLWLKLFRVGIKGELLRIIKEMYSKVKMFGIVMIIQISMNVRLG